MRKLLLIIPVIAIIIGMTTTQMVNGTSAYDSGYNHGCDDADISDSSDMYINGVNDNGESTGPSHHTFEFMNGYHAGFNTCSAGGSIYVDDDHSNQQEQNQAAYTNQKSNCGLILIGNCNMGQSSKNTFANDADND